MAKIQVYGEADHTPYFPDLGGTVHFTLTVIFEETPPEEYDYEIYLKDSTKITVRVK
jgi:hypothetical protein